MAYDKFYVPSHPGGAGLNYGFTVDGGVGGVVLYLLTGQILDSAGVGLDGVTITLSGDETGEIVTSGGGMYVFAVPDGSYTVTPTLLGSTFSPTSRPGIIDGANLTLGDMSQVWAITGTILGELSAPIEGVTVALTGDATDSTTTLADGTYSFPDLPDGNYTVTPTMVGYVFTPSSTAVGVSGADEVADFTGAEAYTISGYVVDGDDVGIEDVTVTLTELWTISGTITGDTVSGVTVALTGTESDSTTTDVNGDYSFLAPNGSYTVTPTLTDHTFDPVSINVTISGADDTDNDSVSTSTYLLLPVTIDFDAETTGQEPASIASKPGGSTVTVAEESLGGHTKLLSVTGGDGRVYISLGDKSLKTSAGFRLQCLIRGYYSANNNFFASPMLSETAPLGTDDYIYCEFSEQENPDRIQVGGKIGASTDTNNIDLGTNTTDNDPKYIRFEYNAATEVAKVTVLTVAGATYKAEQTTTLSDLSGSFAPSPYFAFEVSTGFGMNKLAEIWLGKLTDTWPTI
jgi:hypothetical protein